MKTNLKNTLKLSRILLHATFGVFILVGFAGSVVIAAGTSSSQKSTSNSQSTSAATTTNVNAASVQGYAAASILQTGTVIQLDTTQKNTVSPASYKNLNGMFGVVVDPHSQSLTISDTTLKNEAFVATNGTFDVLVDTQNGPIKAGDYVTMSALDGVAMKAGTYEDQPTIFGRAVGSFDGKTNVIGAETLKDTSGKQIPVSIGLIPVSVNISRNPNQKSTKTNLPPVLQKIGQAIADKPVGPLRIYLSIAVTGLSIIVSIVTLYAGVRSAMISIGRNPLSKKSIFRGLLEVILTGFLILIIGLFAVYLLLKL